MLAHWYGLCRSAPSPHACVYVCVCVYVCASSLQHKAGASTEAAARPTNHNPLEKCCLPLFLYLTVPPSCHLSLWQPFYLFNLYLWLSIHLFFFNLSIVSLILYPYLPLPSPLTVKFHVICVHHLTFTTTPTEMGHRGQARPIVIIIITVIIIFITISRASYYPPPCFPIAKSKVPQCQPCKFGMMPICRIDVRGAFVIWRFTWSLHLFGGRGFAGWIQRWSMIWIRRLFPLFPFPGQCEIWFLFRKEAPQSACDVWRLSCIHRYTQNNASSTGEQRA